MVTIKKLPAGVDSYIRRCPLDKRRGERAVILLQPCFFALRFALFSACSLYRTAGIAPVSSAPQDRLLPSVLLLPFCIFRFVHRSVALKELF